MREHRTYPVEITLGTQTKTYSPEFQDEEQYAFAWKRVLTLAHGQAIVRCLCNGEGEKRLSVHCRSNSDRFHLARFPNTGPEHSEDCIFFGADPATSGMGSYKRGVIEELDDGNTKIKLKIGLKQRLTKAPEDSPDASAAPNQKTRPSASQTSMTLRGLLHYLWTQSHLNRWSPAMAGKRNLGLVHYHLLRLASTTYAGKVKLSQNLLIGTFENGQQARLNQAKSLSAANERRRLVVISPLAKYVEGATTADRFPIAAFHGVPFLSISPELWELVATRFSREMDAWASGSRVIAIVQTDPPRRAQTSLHADVVDIALMVVTEEWIPVESGYEAVVAEQLIAEGRRFEKPLRFDAREAVFPDFWLKDTAAPVPMEVWGMSTAEYQARKQEKIAHYDATYGSGGWWSWNAANGDPVPAIPPSVAQQ